jgi:hypothetical protein
LHLEEMEEHWPSRLYDALVVGKMKTCDGPWSAPFDYSHVGGKFVLPCAKLVQDAVHLVYVEAFCRFGDAVYLGHWRANARQQGRER